MSEKELTPTYCVFESISSGEAAGYEFVQALTEEVVETHQDVVMILGSSGSSNYNNKEMRPFVVKKLRYLMKKSGNLQLAKLEKLFKESEELRGRAERRAFEIEQAIADNHKRFVDMNEKYDKQMKEMDEFRSKHSELNNKLWDYERMLGSVRRAIGDLQFMKIIEDSKVKKEG